MVRTVVMGTMLGIVCGMIFSVLYFGAGQLTSPMAYIHEVSGGILGFLIAMIIGFARKAAKKG